VIYRVETDTKKKVAQSIRQKIAQGRPIADGMTQWFPPYVVELVRAGETGGTLTANIRSAAESLGQKADTLASFVSALTYPLVVILAGCGVAVYLNHSIFGQFMKIKPLAQWPAVGQKLVGFANFVQDGWWLSLVFIAAVSYFTIKLLTSYIGPLRKSIDALPALSIYRELKAARFMETLGLLVSNGVVFKQALKILSYNANPYLSYHLMLMERKLAHGRGNIADVLDTGMISQQDVVRLRAIADAKGFEHALVRLGKQAAANSVKTLKKSSRILGGILLAVAAGLAIFMVLGIYSVGSSLAY
jgi:type IV pilus assembly protein PilC